VEIGVKKAVPPCRNGAICGTEEVLENMPIEETLEEILNYKRNARLLFL